nr:ubiquinol-cytochrome-c reductase complex assembly factor 2-like [Lepeophtheirus salmonis]
MSSSSSRQTWLKLIKSWPSDLSKRNRDFAQILKERSDPSSESEVRSLEKLLKNEFSNKYRRVHSEATATVLGKEDLKTLTSTDFLESSTNYANLSFWERLKLQLFPK